MGPTHRQEVEAILAGAAAERAALLDQLSPALRASLPVDATGITQAIDHLGEIAGLPEDLHREQAQAHKTNAAVLHARVFGRAPLSPDTVLAAFADGARVRGRVLAQLAQAVGGDGLEAEVLELIDGQRLDDEPGLRAAYAAQERAAVRIAEHLDAAGGA